MTESTHGGMPPPTNIPGKSPSIIQMLVSSTGKRVYTDLPKFGVGKNQLWVFCNGKKEYCKLDYEETSSVSIKFLKHIPKGNMLEFLVFK